MKTNKKRKNRRLSALLSSALAVGCAASAFNVFAQGSINEEMGENENVPPMIDGWLEDSSSKNSEDNFSTSETTAASTESSDSAVSEDNLTSINNPDSKESNESSSESDKKEDIDKEDTTAVSESTSKPDTSEEQDPFEANSLAGLLFKMNKGETLNFQFELPLNYRLDPVNPPVFYYGGFKVVDTQSSGNTITVKAQLPDGFTLNKNECKYIQENPRELTLQVYCLKSDSGSVSGSAQKNFSFIPSKTSNLTDGIIPMVRTEQTIPEGPQVFDHIDLPMKLSVENFASLDSKQDQTNTPFGLIVDIDLRPLAKSFRSYIEKAKTEEGKLPVWLHFEPVVEARLTLPNDLIVEGKTIISQQLEDMGFSLLGFKQQDQIANDREGENVYQFGFKYRGVPSELNEWEKMAETFDRRITFTIESVIRKPSTAISSGSSREIKLSCNGSLRGDSKESTTVYECEITGNTALQIKLPSLPENTKYSLPISLTAGSAEAGKIYSAKAGEPFDLNLAISPGDLQDMVKAMRRDLLKAEGLKEDEKPEGLLYLPRSRKVTFEIEVTVPDGLIRSKERFAYKVESGTPLFDFAGEYKLTNKPGVFYFDFSMEPSHSGLYSFQNFAEDIASLKDGLKIQVSGFQLSAEATKGQEFEINGKVNKTQLVVWNPGVTNEGIPTAGKNVVFTSDIDLPVKPAKIKAETVVKAESVELSAGLLIDGAVQKKDVKPRNSVDLSSVVDMASLSKALDDQLAKKKLDEGTNINSDLSLNLVTTLPDGVKWQENLAAITVNDPKFTVTGSDYKNNILTVSLKRSLGAGTVEDLKKAVKDLQNNKLSVNFGPVTVSDKAKKNQKLEISTDVSGILAADIRNNDKVEGVKLELSADPAEATLNVVSGQTDDNSGSSSSDSSTSQSSSKNSSDRNSSKSTSSSSRSSRNSSSTSRRTSSTSSGSKTSSSKKASNAKTSASTDRQLFGGIAGIAVFGAAAVWMLMKKKND